MTKPTSPQAITEQTLAEADQRRIAAEAEATVSAGDAIRIGAAHYTEERDLANQLLGQAQMAQAISKIADVSALLKLQHVKERKLYRHITASKTADGQQFTWSEYCKALGRSFQSVDEDLRNLNTLGEEALGALSSMGVGTRELRKLRKLPEDERLAVINSEQVDLNDKDAVVELIEEMAVRSATLKETMQRKEAEVNEEREAFNAQQQEKNKRIDDLATELHHQQGRSMPWDERVQPLTEEIDLIRGTLAECFSKLYLMHSAILNMPEDNDPEDRALTHLASVYEDLIAAAAQQVGELQYKFDEEMSGIVVMQREAQMKNDADV